MSDTPLNPFNDFVFVNATQADRGSFTLALDKALDKLEKFQLPDPSYFVLQWVQALVAGGAQSISIQLDVNTFKIQYEMKIVFDGPGYTARELQSLYDHVFLSGRDRAQDRLRELALGWLSASSLKPARLAITSNGWMRVRDKAVSKSAEQTTQLPLDPSAAPGHLLEISGRGAYPFEQILTSCCSDVPIALFLNGTQISHPTVATGVPWPNRPFENGPSKGVMGATYGASASQIAFLRYGVNFVSRSEPALLPPVIVRVSDPTLSKNVSQTDVVRDEAYEEFLGRLRHEMKVMGLSLTGKRVPSYQRDALNRYLQAYIASHLDIRALKDQKRLSQLGPEYESLINYPVFCSNKGVYRSLRELYQIYKKQQALLYCLDPGARAVAWAGVLLVLEPDELAVLRKFFPNMIGLSMERVREQSRMGRSASGNEAQDAAAVLLRRELRSAGRSYTLTLLDTYPTGVAVLQPAGGRFGTAIPGLKLTMSLEYLDVVPPTHTEVVSLSRAIVEVLPSLLADLATVIRFTGSAAFSRNRAAELYCEILSFQLAETTSDNARQDLAFEVRQNATPLVSLEDGTLVSLLDITTFLALVPQVYVGGAFMEGLESGALDPMPEAGRLLTRLFAPHYLAQTEKVREQLREDSELRFAFRRQKALRGLGQAPDPKRALEQFANEAAKEAAELARIEQEYRKALEGPALFVQPDQQRLEAVAAQVSDEGDLPLFDLSSQGDAPVSSGSPLPEARIETPVSVPSLEADMELCRHHDPDLFPDRGSVQIERWDTRFSLRLATCPPGQGTLLLLDGDQVRSTEIGQPVRGFVRSLDPGRFEELFDEGLEHLTIKAISTFSEGPTNSRMRRALRSWLLHLSCGNLRRLLASQSRLHDLFDMAVVPCLGSKHLSWRTLLEQAHRVGETVVVDGSPDLVPCPNREVILCRAPVTSELLEALGFPAPRVYAPAGPSEPFESLYRSTRRDLASVLSGQSTPLLQTNLVEQLASDASLWQRWRAGFLSWNRDQAVVVMNPNHKVGKKLAKRFSTDPSWSHVFASALFSTINRGLEEVEDKHERAFLESLVEMLD